MNKPIFSPEFLKAANQIVEQCRQLFEPVLHATAALREWADENPEFFAQLAQWIKTFQELPERQRIAWSHAATRGWYTNWETPITVTLAVEANDDSLDAFMIDHLKRDWNAVTAHLLRVHPDRAHIFQCAFDLHQSGKYIAAIPLFLAQADGICAQNMRAYFFSEHEKRKLNLAERLSTADEVEAMFLEILGVETQFQARIDYASKPKKALAPNRNGILHGSRKHLDYGTEVNSWKAFSLLSYIAFIFEKVGSPSDEVSNDSENVG